MWNHSPYNSASGGPNHQSPIAHRHTLIPLSLAALSLALLLSGCAGLGAAPVCMAGATLDSGGECRAQQAPTHHIPFREGFKTRVMQGFHGYLSHKKDLAFSIDFRCAAGTPVVASKAGRVWDIREDSNTGCADPTCIEDANYVIIDHGDGTFSEYYHLRQFGALIEPGEQICAGEVIGLCGNTGYSTGAHLHFALTDATRHTVPVRFYEAIDQQDFGFAIPETDYVSQNELQTQCSPTRYSRLPLAAFAHQGIILTTRLPLVIDHRAARQSSPGYPIRGTYHGDHPMVAIHRKAVDGEVWTDECVPVDADGEFAARIKWPRRRFESGSYWFMITGADEDCLSPGWAWSYRVRVLD
jgi:hypothetical protein